MDLNLKNDRIYPKNVKFTLNGETLEVEYILRVPKEIVPIMPPEKAFKTRNGNFWVKNTAKIRPISESNIETAYNYLKSLTMRQMRQAKLKYAQMQLDKAEESKVEPSGQLSLF